VRRKAAVLAVLAARALSAPRAPRAAWAAWTAALALGGLTAAGAPCAAQELMEFLRVPAVAGQEQPAAAFMRAHLGAELAAHTDAAGNVTVTVGTGAPRRLVVCPLGEPGFVVSGIQDDGYLRLAAAGPLAPTGTLWEQAHEGQVVWVAGAHGAVPGGVATRSVHFGAPDPMEPPFALTGAYVDVGAASAAEVAALGIRLLDPVALDRRPQQLAGGLVAGPSARVKGACLAATAAARRLHHSGAAGSVVFAWTAQDLVNRAGTDYLLRHGGPFTELIDLGWGFGWASPGPGPRLGSRGRTPRPMPLPLPGQGLPVAGALAGRLSGTTATAYLEPYLSADEQGLAPPRTGHLGLPARYPGTPVETVATADVDRLAAALVELLGPATAPRAGGGAARRPAAEPVRSQHAVPMAPAATTVPAPAARAGAGPRHAAAAALLAALVARSGVSGNEAAVRAVVRAELPAWAHPTVDRTGNLVVSFGGSPRTAGAGDRLFMAHMDEVGFEVGAVLPDGRLKLRPIGGLRSTLWEAQAALVQGTRGPVAGVFEPRLDWLTAEHRGDPGQLVVALGAANPAEVAALGIQVGSGVTMPKGLLRLGPHRALARSMDDRVGDTALLLALRRIDPAKLHHRLTFAWTTREEVGLFGAAVLARTLATPRQVFPVDTFVSSDSPIESHHLGYAPLGHGAVLRGMDSASSAPHSLVAWTLDLGRRRGIPLTLGVTAGGTDGIPFMSNGAAVLPISWPGRYSHSPVEVADLRDVESLVDLIVALATAEP
jgi:putative aminopeptidase FrvX